MWHNAGGCVCGDWGNGEWEDTHSNNLFCKWTGSTSLFHGHTACVTTALGKVIAVKSTIKFVQVSNTVMLMYKNYAKLNNY